MRHSFILFIATLAGISSVCFTGCGGGDNSPVAPVPEPPDLTEPASAPDETSGTHSWGTWILHCEDAVGEEPAHVEAIPLRAAEQHFDIVNLLEPPKCTNCLELEIDSIVDLDWTIIVSLTNPSIFTGYDVRGVFPGTDDPTILNPSSYTNMFDIDSDWNTHNPYIIFETENVNRSWEPAETHSQTITFRREPGETFVDLVYVAAVSWPDPQDEIVELRNPQSTGPLFTDASSPANFTVEVIDWQDDIEYVLMDLSPVLGGAYTHMQPIGDGVYQIYSYASYALSPGTVDLKIAAKSLGSPKATYNYLTIEIMDPIPPPTNYDLYAGPVTLLGEGVPNGEMDLAVIGKTDGTSTTLVHGSSTTIFAWNETYTQSGLFVTLIDPSGEDTDFPVEPVSRIAVADPTIPADPLTYTILQTNLDSDIWNLDSTPVILCRDVLQILDMDQLALIDFELTADNPETPELDAIARPIEVASGVGSDRYGYTLWIPDGGQNPLFYPFVTLVRYEPPYKEELTDYDRLIGGVIEGSGDGKVRAEDVTGLAVWDGDGDGNLLIAISEGGDTGEVEIFTADYIADPEGLLTHVTTLSGFVGEPVDVAILPVGDAGLEDDNWIVILTGMKTIETHTVSGEFVESWLNPNAFTATPLHMDVDTENLRIHVIMEGAIVSVIEYTGD